MRRAVRSARTAVSAALLVVLAACNPSGEEPDPAPTSQAAAPEEVTTSPSPVPTPSPSPSPTLPARYSQDSDGNLVPDFVEEELGYDPEVDDCALASCPEFDEVRGLDTTSLDQNVLLSLDASGSMAGPDGSGRIKIDAARAALERYAYGSPPNYRLGLQVFGHRGSNQPEGKAESCAGIDLISPLGSLTPDSAAEALNQFQPTGFTPIAAALQQAASAFEGQEEAANRVILVTDGIETCDGDPVAAAMALKQSGVAVTVDVVGFDIEGEADRAALQQIAESTGGTYTDARDAAALDAYIDDLLAQQAQLLDAVACVSQSFNETQICAGEFNAAVRDYMFSLSRQEDRATALLIEERYNRSLTRYQEEFARRRALRQEQIAPLRQQFFESRQRYIQRYGRDVALGELCMDRLL